MRFSVCVITTILQLFLLVTNLLAQGALTDPLEILRRHFDAIGGLEKLQSERTNYFEGSITIEGTGLQGTIKMWTANPLRQRQETDLTIFKQVTGDNGEFSWMVDANSKVIIQKDEQTIKRRKVRELLESYAQLDPTSETFAVTFEGIEKVDDIDCYVIKTANSVNEDIRLEYINTTTFLMEKLVEKQPDTEQHIRFSEYHEVGGIQRSFHHDIESFPIKQDIVIQLTKYETDIDIDPVLFNPPGEDVEDYAFVSGNKAENTPFQFIENHLYLPVNLKGKEKLWILDSGAGMTCIDSGFAVELGLTTEGNLKGQGAGNQVNISFVDLPPFSITGIEFDEQKAASLNLRPILHKSLGLDAVGILGFDFLSRFVTKIDYAKELISFYDPADFSYEGNGTVVDAPLSDRFFTVPVTVDNEYSGLWNFDLGAGNCDFHFPFASAHVFLNRKGIERIGRGAGGTFSTRLVRFDNMEFGGFIIPEPVIGFPLEEGQGAFNQAELIGNLGNTLFRHFVLYLDYEKQQLIVEKGDDFDSHFPRDNSGLQVQMVNDTTIEVLFAAPGTPAEKAGFLKTDIIRSINSIDVKHFNGVIAIRELLRKEPGTEYVFSVLRDGEEKKIKLKLKDLF